MTEHVVDMDDSFMSSRVEMELSPEEKARRLKFNSRVLPWTTVKTFTLAEDVETWKVWYAVHS